MRLATSAALVLALATAAAAQQPAAPPAKPTAAPPSAQPDSGAARDSTGRGAPRPGMLQDSMARRGTTHDSMSGAVIPTATRSADTTLTAKLDSVDAAAKSGLTTLPLSVALPLIEGIETRLRASGRPSLRGIAADLAELRRELGMPAINRVRVGTILRRVGPKVTAAAAAQAGAVRTTLRAVGDDLTAAGRQLSAPR